jgi:hypothetical protein
MIPPPLLQFGQGLLGVTNLRLKMISENIQKKIDTQFHI